MVAASTVLKRIATSTPLFAALTFVVVASPSVYAATDSLARHVRVRTATNTGHPTRVGLILHALVMYLLVLLFMKAK